MTALLIIRKKLAVSSALLIVTLTSKAQETAAPGAPQTNWLEVLLIASAIVLLFVIWSMGQVLLILAKKLNAKRKSLAKGTIMAMIF